MAFKRSEFLVWMKDAFDLWYGYIRQPTDVLQLVLSMNRSIWLISTLLDPAQHSEREKDFFRKWVLGLRMTPDSSVRVNGGSSLYRWKISSFLSNGTANTLPAKKVSVKTLCLTHSDRAGPRQAHREQGHANHIKQSGEVPQTSPGKPQTGNLIMFSITALPQVKQLDSHPYSHVAFREYCPVQPFPVAICRALHSSSYSSPHWDTAFNSRSLHTPLLLTDNHSHQHRKPGVEIPIYNRVCGSSWHKTIK